MPASARLTLSTVISPPAVQAGGFLEKALTREAEEWLETAQGEVASRHGAELHLREGPTIRLLLDELAGEHATLVALGSHGHSRATGMAFGSVASAMLHEAPCSVLIVHATAHTEESRHGVLVGFDGSAGARRALAAGRELAQRLSLDLRVVVGSGDRLGRPGWLEEEIGPELALIEDPRDPVEALLDASASCGLLILGSRHLRGVPALGSVSERVAHGAGCPVLVVR
jgi:nucleotide-binding universal stress UspA family protein